MLNRYWEATLSKPHSFKQFLSNQPAVRALTDGSAGMGNQANTQNMMQY